MNPDQSTTALPAGLAGVLNRPGPEEQRDSAYYSNMDASSKRMYLHSEALRPCFSTDVNYYRYLDSVD